MLIFTPIERSTLLKLWDDEEEWWQFWWVLSDRLVEDGDEDGARFMRWLKGWRNRPADGFAYPSLNWYCRRDAECLDPTTCWERAVGDCGNYLPVCFAEVCCEAFEDKSREVSSDDPIHLLELALHHYRTLTDDQKADLDDNWRAP